MAGEKEEMTAGLVLILLLVLVLPFLVRRIEENLEVFLFIMGICATCISGAWVHQGHFNWMLLKKAVSSPLMITAAVFIAGMLFEALETQLKAGVEAVIQRISFKLFVFLLIVVLGLVSSLITAIIASLVLVEVINALKLERKQEVELTIIACLSIGLGAVLTPVGEPLATIAISRLEKDFWYLMRLLGVYVVPGIIALGCFAAFYIKPIKGETLETENGVGTYREILARTARVYLFVAALEMLGEGFKPVVDTYIIGLQSNLLYWLNTVSAVLDNATLTAAEVSIKMSAQQIRCILMGLLISGGMLIPGNIPNIITAGKLGVRSREWARLGVPLGLTLMVIYFLILNVSNVINLLHIHF